MKNNTMACIFDGLDIEKFKTDIMGSQTFLWTISQEHTNILTENFSTENLVYLAGGEWGKISVASTLSPSSAEFELINNTTPSPELISELHSLGYTLVFNDIQETVAGAYWICESISAITLGHTNCNAYLTPPGHQALNKHYDDHDVFIIQLAGQKRWKTYNTDYPIKPIQNLDYAPAILYTTKMERESLLTPGAVLYIPAGVPHEAVAEGCEASLHFSVSLQPLNNSELATQLLKETTYQMKMGLLLRHPISLTPSARLKAFEKIKEETTYAIEANIESAYNNLIRQHLLNSNPLIKASIAHPEHIGTQTNFGLNPFQYLHFDPQERRAYFKGGSIALEPGYCDLISNLIANKTCSLSEFPEASDKGKIASALALLENRILSLDSRHRP